jgi:regulator of sigma E protease
MNLLWYVGAFAVALGILIVVHEFGHYLVARWSGVKVLRFSVGFGRPLLTRRLGRDGTEWVLAAFPLGGYVKMLDEREAPVAPAELPRAFNRQPVGKRFAIVAAGPLANFLLAILFYWGLNVYGVDELKPLLSSPAAGTVAQAAGFEEGELVLNVDGKPVATWQDLRWEILQHALEKRPVDLETLNERREINRRRLDLSGLDTEKLEEDLQHQLGLRPLRPRLPAVVGKVAPGSVAEAAGLRTGDLVVAADGTPIAGWADLVSLIREAPGRSVQLEWERDGARLSAEVVPSEVQEGGRRIGRIGVGVREDPAARDSLVIRMRYGPVDALGKAISQTWETATFTLSILGKMLTGEVSWRNLSGPVTIADYAGQSARLGPTHYIKFLALISISLGVLNLLPIPILDGGHLMYYLVEIVKGGPVSERAMEIGQQVGLALLVLLMAFAFYNDINRLISG